MASAAAMYGYRPSDVSEMSSASFGAPDDALMYESPYPTRTLSPLPPGSASPHSEDSSSASDSFPHPRAPIVDVRNSPRLGAAHHSPQSHQQTQYSYHGQHRGLPMQHANYGMHDSPTAYYDNGMAPKRVKASEGHYVNAPQMLPIPPRVPIHPSAYHHQPSPHYYGQHPDMMMPAHHVSDERHYAQMRYSQPHPAQLHYGGPSPAPLDGIFGVAAPSGNSPPMASVHPRDEIFRSKAAAAAHQQGPYPYIGGDDLEALQASLDSSTRSVGSDSDSVSTRKKRSRAASPEHNTWSLDDDGLGKNTIINVKHGVTITAEELIAMNPQDLEDYLKSLNLTPDQEQHVKRQRRLMKNRESAQVSRMKKKRYVEELEDKVQELANKTESLMKKLNDLQKENEMLSKELETYKGSESVDIAADVEAVKGKPNSSTSRSGTSGEPKMTQVYLLVILFAFGLFISSPDSQQSMIFPHREFTTFTKLPLTDPYVVRRLQSLSYMADNAAQMNVSVVDRGGSPAKHGIYVHCSPTNIESKGDQLPLDMLRVLAENPEKAQSALSIIYALSKDTKDAQVDSQKQEQQVEVTCNVVNSKLYVR